MKKKLLFLSLSLMLTLLIVNMTQASIVWDWSFANESGHFITTGGVASPGTYTMTDFSVVSSTAGGTIGSLSGGNYQTGDAAFGTTEPFTFDWDGTNVTLWKHVGSNSFDWWAFKDTVKTNLLYFFGWNTGNINDPRYAALYDSNTGGGYRAVAVGLITVQPSSPVVPVPAALWLLGSGLLGLLGVRRTIGK